MKLYKKSIDDSTIKKIFCLGACFLIFSQKNQKTGAQTSFYFAAEGGEIFFHYPEYGYELG
jgi:hypothetical protein